MQAPGAITDDFIGGELLAMFLHPPLLFFRRQRDEFVFCIVEKPDRGKSGISGRLGFHERGTAKVRFFKILRDFDCLDIHEAKDVADGILHGTVVEGSPAVLYGNGIATVVRPWEGIVVFQYFPDGEGAVFRRVFLHEGATGRAGINGGVFFPQCVESGAATAGLADAVLADQVLPDFPAVYP